MIDVVSSEDFRPGVASVAKAPRLLHIILMILLGHVELFGQLNLSGNWLAQLLLMFCQEFLRYRQLLLIDAPYPTSVLSSIVRPLTIYLRRVVHQEEPVEKLSKGNSRRVKNDAHSFSMACVPLAYHSVRRIFHPSLLIPAVRSEDPRCHLKGMLDAPEATTSKVSHLVTVGDLMVSGDTV